MAGAVLGASSCLAVDEPTGEIVAHTLTTNDVHDQSEAPNLLDQIDAPIGTFLGDGAYDTRSVYGAVARHGDGGGESALEVLDAQIVTGLGEHLSGDDFACPFPEPTR